MKYNNLKAFTLIEIIAVLLILAILAAAAIPTYLGFIEKSKAAICKSNIGLLERAGNAVILGDPSQIDKINNDPKYFTQYLIDHKYADCDNCPSGGIYRTYYDANTKKITIICSAHATAVGGKYAYDLVDSYLQTAAYNKKNGSDLQKSLKASYGGTLPSYQVNGTTYYIKADNRDGSVIFASTGNSSGTQWRVEYFYDDTNSQWYKYSGSPTFYTASHSKSEILDIIENNPDVWLETNDLP